MQTVRDASVYEAAQPISGTRAQRTCEQGLIDGEQWCPRRPDRRPSDACSILAELRRPPGSRVMWQRWASSRVPQLDWTIGASGVLNSSGVTSATRLQAVCTFLVPPTLRVKGR